MQESIRTSLRRLAAMLSAVFLTCALGVMGTLAAPAYADPDAPTTVDSFYDTVAGEIDVWAIDGLAEQAWNMAFEVDGVNGTVWL